MKAFKELKMHAKSAEDAFVSRGFQQGDLNNYKVFEMFAVLLHYSVSVVYLINSVLCPLACSYKLYRQVSTCSFAQFCFVDH